MSIIAKKLKLMQPSATIATAARAAELQAQGYSIISLALGEPDNDTPFYVKEAAIQAIHGNFTKYTAVDGIKELKLAIQQKFLRENQLSYHLDEITVSNGAKQVIFNLLTATLNPDDQVIVAAPYWVSYIDAILFNNARPVIIDTTLNASFKLSPEQLEQAINARTKWLILNSPSNPTGMIYSKEELLELAKVLNKYPHVHILSDDIYEHLTFAGEKYNNIAAAAPELKSRTFVINGVSKAYAMTGWRIGYGAGDAAIIKAMSTLQSQVTSNPCSISQKAACAALNTPAADYFAKNAEYLVQKKDLVYKELATIPELKIYQPQGGFYLFISCANAKGRSTPAGQIIHNGDDFTNYLLEYGVAVTQGSAFGSPDYFRLSYAIFIELLQEACLRIKKACAQLSSS